MIAKTLYDIDAHNRELLMTLSNGDKVQYESYLDSDVIEFWGLVWEFEKRKKREVEERQKQEQLNKKNERG